MTYPRDSVARTMAAARSQRVRFLALLSAVSFAVIGLFPAAAEAQAPSQPTVTVLAGAGEPGYSVTRFLPASVSISTGASVRWEFSWFEPHSVTFGVAQSSAPPSTAAPAVYQGTGFLSSDVTVGPGKSYEVVFERPGTYSYRCAIHEAMTGTVRVTDAGGAPESVLAVAARGRNEYASALTSLRQAADEARREPLTVTALADGTSEFVVNIAAQTSDGDTQQFFPPAITVFRGDTVRWRSRVDTPHTVTFGPFPSGDPLAGVPAAATPARPGGAYEGTGLWNSGLLGVDRAAGTDWSLVFAATGSFPYYCVLHAAQGHVGQVVVLDRPAVIPPPVAPLAPATGTGALRRRDSSQPWTWSALLAAIAAAAVLRETRRRR